MDGGWGQRVCWASGVLWVGCGMTPTSKWAKSEMYPRLVWGQRLVVPGAAGSWFSFPWLDLRGEQLPEVKRRGSPHHWNSRSDKRAHSAQARWRQAGPAAPRGGTTQAEQRPTPRDSSRTTNWEGYLFPQVLVGVRSLKLSQESGKGRHSQECLDGISFHVDNGSSEIDFFLPKIMSQKNLSELRPTHTNIHRQNIHIQIYVHTIYIHTNTYARIYVYM